MSSVYPAFGSPQRLVLQVFRDWFAQVGETVHVGSLLPDDFTNKLPFVLVRLDTRTGNRGDVTKDTRFMKAFGVSIQTFTVGLDAESDGYDLQESCRLALMWAWRTQRVYSGLGHISSFIRLDNAARVSDYATSTGVVQYASLPKGAVRHEAIYQMIMRPPVDGAGNRFVPQLID